MAAGKPWSRGRPSLPSIHLAIEEEKESPVAAKMRISRGVMVVSSGFLLLSTAYRSLQNLQSSIINEADLGAASMALMYIASVISCIFVSSYMIGRLGLKHTMVVAMSMYFVYFLANMKPTWLTLLPGSFVLGLGCGPLWTAKSSYLTTLAQECADVEERGDPAPFISRVFGIFFAMYQTAQVCSALLSYWLFAPPDTTSEDPPQFIERCGASFHPTDDAIGNETAMRSIPESQVLTLSALYTGLVLAAIAVLFIFLDKMPDEVRDSSPPMKLLVETVHQTRQGFQQLMIPLTVYGGMQQVFFWVEFTQAFVSCSWGPGRVGRVMVCHGMAGIISSLTFGFLSARVPRILLVMTAALLDFAVMVRLLTWKPTPQDARSFYLIAICWAVADASWKTQINTFYGILFWDRRNAAFANYQLWESIGLIVMFAVQSTVRVYLKIAGLMMCLAAGVIGYIVIEMMNRSRNLPSLKNPT
ncbi:protein unc-93 homolog A-like [Ornithodoros turicata]|uniref:protein unc-93 homolog A-like n=1 Tax=Ornithodoros turicata TaxID=34597 RepID=UPI003138AA2D